MIADLFNGDRLRRLGNAPAVPAAVAIAFAAVMLTRYQVPLRESATYGAYLLVVIVLPGRLVWRKVLGRIESSSGRCRSWMVATSLEDWVCGASVGYAIELASYPVARAVGHPRLYVLVPVAVLVVIGARDAGAFSAQREVSRPASRWGIAAVAVYLTYWLGEIVFARTPLQPYWPSGEDETFHLALVGELRHHFPAEYPYVEAGRLTYQWFVHVHMAASTWATGIEPLVVYRRFDVLVLSVLAVLGVMVVAMRVTNRHWPGLVAGGLLVLVGTFDITGTALGEAVPEERFLEGGVLLNSPTQTLAFALMPSVVVLCLQLLDGRRSNLRLGLVLAVGVVALSGVKATALPVMLAGFVAALIACSRDQDARRAAGVGAAVTGAVMLVSTQVLYAGDAHSLRLEPGQTTRFFMTRLGMEASGFGVSVVVSAALLVMWVVSASGAVALLKHGETRRDPRVWWLVGASTAGLGATFLLAHDGLSQLYFGRTVAPLLAVLSAWGLSVLFPRGTPVRTGIAAIVLAVAAGVGLLLVRLLTERLRTQMPVEGSVVSQPALRLWMNLPAVMILVVGFVLLRAVVRDLTGGRRIPEGRYFIVLLVGLGLARSLAFLGGHYPAADIETANVPIPAGGIEVARWLKQHSSPDDRVITNAHCLRWEGVARRCDSRHFWMSALSERRFVLEGWAYTRFQEDWYAPYWGPQSVLASNDELFTDPSQHRLRSFVERHPAEWLLLDLGQPSAKRPHLTALQLEFGAGDFVLYRVR